MKKSAVFGMLFTLIAGMAGGVALGIQIERGQAQPPETVSALSSPEPVSAVSVVSADTEQAVMLEVPYIGQQGLLPTGCEIVSACMVLRYYGCDITVHTLADRYLEIGSLTDSGDARIGPHPAECFIGSPYEASGYGCYAPVIERMMNRVLPEGLTAEDTTGTSLDRLTREIDRGNPVLVWATMNMKASSAGSSWRLDNGESFTWPSGEHCLVLVGYDSKTYYFNDPYQNNGLMPYPRELVERRFAELGCQSVTVRQT